MAASMPNPTSAVPGLDRVVAYMRGRGHDHVTAEECGRGDANVAYRVRGPDLDLVLRLAYHSPKGLPLAAAVEREAAVLAGLHGRGVTGALHFTDLAPGLDGHPLLAMEYLPGRALDYRPADLAAAGDLHARLHETRTEPPASIARVTDPRAPYLAEIVPWIERYAASPHHDPDVLYELELARARCERREIPATPALLIHGDGTDVNWRMHRDQARILDWDWCRVTHAAADLGHFLSPITTMRHEGRLLARDEERLVLDAYGAGRPDLDRARFEDELSRFRALVITHSAAWTASYIAALTAGQGNHDKITWLRGHVEPGFLARLREEGTW